MFWSAAKIIETVAVCKSVRTWLYRREQFSITCVFWKMSSCLMFTPVVLCVVSSAAHPAHGVQDNDPAQSVPAPVMPRVTSPWAPDHTLSLPSLTSHTTHSWPDTHTSRWSMKAVTVSFEEMCLISAGYMNLYVARLGKTASDLLNKVLVEYVKHIKESALNYNKCRVWTLSSLSRHISKQTAHMNAEV